MSSAYDIATNHLDREEQLGWVWKVKVTKRCRTFIWLVLKGKILRNKERHWWGLTYDGSCPICDCDEESLDHLFRDCQVARLVWRRSPTPNGFNISRTTSLDKWIQVNYASKEWTGKGVLWSAMFAYLLWGIWKRRNAKVFNNDMRRSDDVIATAEFFAKEASEGSLRERDTTRGYIIG